MGILGMGEEEFICRVGTYKRVWYRIAFGYLGSETLALDAVDEAVYQGFLHRWQLRQPEFFETWMTRILIRVCQKALKHSQRVISLEQADGRKEGEAHTPIREEGKGLAGKQGTLGNPGADEMFLRMAVDNLEDIYKKVISLRYFGGYTIAETAAILDIPEGTVATRTKKALSLLRLELEEKGGNENG